MTDLPTEPSAPTKSPGLATALMQASLRSRLFDEPIEAVAVDRFQVLRLVGQGAMGTVYEAYDPRLDRRLALKVLRSDLRAAAQQMLLEEARALAQVSHPNVVTVFDAGIVEGRVYIAMEFFDGGSLSDWLYDASARPSVPETLDAFAQAGRGLAAAHAVGIVHRDFKPANVLRARDPTGARGLGRIKVGDFGLARALAMASSTETVGAGSPGGGTVTSAIGGTPAYMAPEALDGRVDPRSDQFSFCVALWEALFGERPPAGLVALAGAGMPPAPSHHGVPRRVVAALLRGLAVDPEARWPSMEALLATFERRTSSRMWGIAGGLAVTGMVAATWMLGRAPPPCEPTGTELAGAWDEPLRARGAAAFGALDVPYAAATWRDLEIDLDAYATGWETARREACEASVVRHERSAEAHDLASACLQQRRESLAALTDLLATADTATAEQAASAVAALPDTDDCGDPDALRTWGLLPPESETRANVAALRRGLASVAAQVELGRPRAAAAMIPQWLGQAETIGIPHAHAEALHLHGRIAQGNGEPEVARLAYRQALEQAARAGDDHFAATLWPDLIFVVGDVLVHTDEALALELPARVALARIADDPLVLADLEHALGSTYRAADQLEPAEASHRRALALVREHAPDDSLLIGESLNRLAGVRAHQREAADAIALLQEVRTRYIEALAPGHPRIGSIEFNLGSALTAAGRMEEAVTHLRAAVAIQRAALGPTNPRTANALAMLGTVLGQLGEVDEGIVVCEEALAAVADRPDHPQVPMMLNNLGGLYHQADRLQDSADAHQRAIDLLRARNMTDSSVFAMNVSNLALMQTALGQSVLAEANFLAAIATYERVYGPEHPDLWRPNAMLARLYRTTARAATALPFAERAVAVLDGVTSDPNEVADAEFELAQVRWDVGQRDPETTALAQRARARWVELDLRTYVATVDEWLATHAPELHLHGGSPPSMGR